MINVLHIITSVERGGAQSFLLRLLSSTQDNVHHHIICFKKDDVFFEWAKTQFPNILYINLLSLGSIFNLFKIIRRFRPNLIQTWLYHSDLIGSFLAVLFRLPLVWNIRNGDLISGNFLSRSGRLSMYLCSIISHKLNKLKIICNSQSAIDFHLTYGYARKFKLITNGIECSNTDIIYDYNTTRLSSNTDRVIKFVNISRYNKVKAHDFLFKAFAKFMLGKGAELYCYGKDVDNSNEYLVKSLIELGLLDKVKLMGTYESLSSVFSEIDFLVHTAESESFPNVIIEAMSFGVPCISSDVGDVSMIIKGNGFVYKKNSIHELLLALEFAYSIINTELYRAMRYDSKRSIIERFNIEDRSLEYVCIWNQSLVDY